MQKYVKKSCPICNGSRTMSIIQYVGLLKKLVRVPCTACEGKGKINFLDKSISEEKSEETNVKSIDIKVFQGWRKSKTWQKIHFFTDGKSLCGNIRSKKGITQSTNVDESKLNESCAICMKIYNETNNFPSA